MTHCRLTGIANIVYSVLLLLTGILFYILFPINSIDSNYSLLIDTPSWIPINIIVLIATGMGIIGTLGIYLKQAEKSGHLALIGFLSVMFGMILKACATSWEIVIWPAILRENPLNPLLTESLIYQDVNILTFYGAFTLFFIIGYLLFGISSLKAGVFPKWVSVLLMTGGPGYAILLSLPPFGLVGLLLYSVSIFGCGLFLYRDK